MQTSRRIIAIFALPLLVLGGAQALATPRETVLDCLGADNDRRISGCTVMIETPDLPPEQRSLAHGMRALAYSMKGMFEKSLHDYDRAIALKPDFAAALNNRAWAYFKLGRAVEGSADVERALKLSPGSPYALDTRAHIRQFEGDTEGAFDDYELAMRHGGERLIKLYQCGLRSQGLYFGPIDGARSTDLRGAMRTCARTRACDPLPSDEDCRPTIS
jgi:tetratricopeptide (TPR) repeat protein